MSMKKFPNDTIGNRTRDLRACSAVHQPTAPTRTPNNFFSSNSTQKRRLSYGQTRHYRLTYFVSLYDCLGLALTKPLYSYANRFSQGPTPSNDFLRINLPARWSLKIQRPFFSSTTDFHPPLHPNKKLSTTFIITRTHYLWPASSTEYFSLDSLNGFPLLCSPTVLNMPYEANRE